MPNVPITPGSVSLRPEAAVQPIPERHLRVPRHQQEPVLTRQLAGHETFEVAASLVVEDVRHRQHASFHRVVGLHREEVAALLRIGEPIQLCRLHERGVQQDDRVGIGVRRARTRPLPANPPRSSTMPPNARTLRMARTIATIRRTAAGSSDAIAQPPNKRDGRRHRREVPERQEVDGRQRRHQEERDDGEQQPGAEQHQGRRSRGRRRDPDAVAASARRATRGTPTRPAPGGAARPRTPRRTPRSGSTGTSVDPTARRAGSPAGRCRPPRSTATAASRRTDTSVSPRRSRMNAYSAVGDEDEREEVVHPHHRDGEQGVDERARPATPVIEPPHERVGGSR